MEYDNCRPTKRARVENVSFQPDLAAGDRVPKYQPEWTREATPFIRYQEHVPIATAWPKEHALAQSNGTNVRHQIPSDNSGQLTISAVGYNGLGGQYFENTLDDRRNVNKGQDFWPAHTSPATEPSCTPLQPILPSFAPRDEYGRVPQQYVPQVGSWPPQPMRNEEQETSFFPRSAHSDSYSQPANVDLIAQCTRNLDVIPQPAVPQVEPEKVCFGMVSDHTGKPQRKLNILGSTTFWFLRCEEPECGYRDLGQIRII